MGGGKEKGVLLNDGLMAKIGLVGIDVSPTSAQNPQMQIPSPLQQIVS